MTELLSLDAMVALISLTAMEIVLGIDNIVFIAILVGKLPKPDQPRTRKIGIGLALITRLLLLLSISWVMGLTEPLFTAFSRGVSGRDLILLFGGLFLIGKSTFEIHEKLEAEADEPHGTPEAAKDAGKRAVRSVILQITVLDIVFSLDSVITAVGMAQQLWIMVTAMVIAVVIMLLASGKISDFVHEHPTVKILALSFLLLIGVMLVGEAVGVHIPKGMIYFAMAFSLGVEMLNIKYRRKTRAPVQLRGTPPN